MVSFSFLAQAGSSFGKKLEPSVPTAIIEPAPTHPSKQRSALFTITEPQEDRSRAGGDGERRGGGSLLVLQDEGRLYREAGGDRPGQWRRQSPTKQEGTILP
jgi:hypothetical protein